MDSYATPTGPGPLWFFESPECPAGLIVSGEDLFLLFGYAIGAAAALFTKSVRSAVLLGLGLVALLVVGLPWLVTMASPAGAGTALVRVANECNVFQVLGRFHAMPGQPARSVGLAGVLPFCRICGGLTLAMLVAVFRRFHRISGRARG